MVKRDGNKLKKLYESMKPPTPEELAVRARMSTSNLRKVFRNEAAEDAMERAAEAIESARQELLSKLQCKTAV